MRRTSLLRISLSAAACAAAFAAPQASAADIGHSFSTSFEGSGTNALSSGITGVDVDDSAGASHGDVYVADASNHRVEKFSGSGVFILMFGDEVDATTSGDVCTAASGDTCQAGKGGTSAEELGTPTWITVDGSSSASEGDVYVADTNDNTIHKYDENGNLITGWGTGGTINGSTSSSAFANISGIDVNPTNGQLDTFSSSDGRFRIFNQDSSFASSFNPCRGHASLGVGVTPDGNQYYKVNGDESIERITPGGECLQISDYGEGSGMSSLGVDQVTGTLYRSEHNRIGEWKFNGEGKPLNATNEVCGAAESCPATHNFGSGELSNSNGVGINTATNTVYVADAGNHRIAVFTAALAPLPVTEEPIANTAVSGTVKPDGAGEVVECYFEFGKTTAYGSKESCTPGPKYSTDTPVTATLPGLEGEVTYHYRLVARNLSGVRNFGADKTIIPHNVKGLKNEPVTAIARTSAKLSASFEGDGTETKYYFEWGTTSAYGEQSAVPPGTSAGSPTYPPVTDISFTPTNLDPGTTYHYNVVAENSTGKSPTQDATFTTLPAVEDVATGSATELSATTATLNGSYTGNGEDTHFYFEYGLDTSYGRTSTAPPGVDNGSSSGPHSVSSELIGLQVNGTYHYRLVADNAVGKTYGPDQTLTTLGAYEFSGNLGSEGSGDGQLLAPRDVAVNRSSGDIYVADTGNHRVVELDSAGHFLAAWGEGVSNGASAAQVCTSSCQAGVEGAGAGEFIEPSFIEIDNSSGPSAGDLYVADTADSVVQKFDPSGHLIASWEEGGLADFSGGGSITGITVDEVGDLIVGTGQSPYYWTTIGQDGVSRTKFATDNYGLYPLGTGMDVNSSGAIYETTYSGVSFLAPGGSGESHLSLKEAGLPLGLVIDRSTNDVYVSQGSQIAVFAASVPCGNRYVGCPQTGTLGGGQLSSADGLALDPTTKDLYAADEGAGTIARFSPLPVPSVSTGEAQHTESTATLSGHVDPGSGTISSCYFQYGTESDYELGSVPCNPATPINSPTEVSAEINGLTPFTTYHYRLVAIRSDGKGLPAYGRDQTVTPGPLLTPAVDGTSATDVTETAAILNAQINPNLGPTVYRFEYGTSAEYESRTAISESIGEDAVDHPVSREVTELKPGTTYHFHVLAININGTTAGPDITFETSKEPEPIVTPPPVKPPSETQPMEPPRLVCKAGYLKKKGRCVKKPAKHHHHRHHRHGKQGSHRG